MILYHVSQDLTFDGYFQPRIPKEPMTGENDTIFRISAAPTISQCFGAIPRGGVMFHHMCHRCDGYFKVFRIDTEKVGISEENIVRPHTLKEKELVPDAWFHEEHWITTPFSVSEEDHLLIQVQNWKEELQAKHIQTNKYVGEKEVKEQNLWSSVMHEKGFVMLDLKYDVLADYPSHIKEKIAKGYFQYQERPDGGYRILLDVI